MGANCMVCGRQRIIMADKQLCLACAVGLTHRCPECKKIVPGSGYGPCYPCAKARVRRVRIGEEARTISHPWLAELFRAYCTSDIFPLEAKIADDRIARASAACRRITLHVTDPTDLTMETVFAALGEEALRRVEPMIAYWATIGALEWNQAQLQTLIELDRVTAILMTHGKGPNGPVLHHYRDHLAIRDRKPITQRIALTAAATLLAALGDAPIANLSQRHVAHALRARPRDRTVLQSFLSFLGSEGGPKLTIAKPRQDPAAQKKRLQADIRKCRKRLHKTCDVVEARASSPSNAPRWPSLRKPSRSGRTVKRWRSISHSPTRFASGSPWPGRGARRDTRGSFRVETGSGLRPRGRSPTNSKSNLRGVKPVPARHERPL
jgi:hypothetical protein